MEGELLVKRLEPLVEAEVDGELMGLSIEHGTCFGFNETATIIWRTIETPRTVDEICRELTMRYEVDHDVCLADLSVALRHMAGQGLVSLTPAR